MEHLFNYEKAFKIEVLNEFANGVYAKLLNYMFKHNIDTEEDAKNHYAILLNHFTELLRLNLFKLSDKELEDIDNYWMIMNKYVEKITKED